MNPKQEFERIWNEHNERYWYHRREGYAAPEIKNRMEDERWIMSMLRTYMEQDGVKLDVYSRFEVRR